MAQPPTKDQLDAWVKDGVITAQQAALLATPPVETAPPAEAAPQARRPWQRFDAGPRPDWRTTRSPLVGLGVALALATVLVVIDTVLSKYPAFADGKVARWGAVAACVVMAAATLLSNGERRQGLLMSTVTLAALLPLLDPAAPAWSGVVAVVVVAAVHVLDLPPATRLVLAVITLPLLAGVLGTLMEGSYLVMAFLLGYLLVVWFTVPFESGWRRVPFFANVALALVAVIALVAILATGSVSFNDGKAEDGGVGGIGQALLVCAGLALYPYLVYRLWQDPRARRVVVQGRVRLPVLRPS